MKSKKKQIAEEKKLFSNRKAIIVSSVLVVVIISGFLILRIFLQSPEPEFSLKAAIVDQIGENYPSNPESAMEFNNTATSILEQAGFSVYYHESQSVTVNFYKELDRYNYGIIILRSHFAKRSDETVVDIFTSEEYSEGVYDNVAKGSYTWEPGKYYFAITPDFVRNLSGQFPKTVVIAMGCWSLKPEYEEMANAFIQKGATVYAGWTEEVDIGHSDNETIRLLRMLLEQDRTVSDAVSRIYPDLHFSPMSEMNFYPLSAGDLRISALKATVKSSQIVLGSLEQNSQIQISDAARLEIRRL